MSKIIQFFVTDADNVVIQSGSTQESHLKDNAVPGKLHIGLAPYGQHRYVNGKFVPIEPDVDYQTQRRMEYPSVSEQMDMLWHSMNTGASEKVEPFYSAIKEVKDKYPKTAG